jgi:adenylate cyclase
MDIPPNQPDQLQLAALCTHPLKLEQSHDCPNCQSTIKATQQFCSVCGVKLQIACHACGRPILNDDRFCSECGIETGTTKKPAGKQKKIASERKYITVLFADVSGYTTMAEHLDPEEVRDLVSHIIGEIEKVVISYGGQSEKFAGDQIMALFGVPLAHEEDPVRAVKTADELHEVVRNLSHQVHKTTSGQPLAAMR